MENIKAIQRSRLAAKRDPNLILSEHVGPAFAEYRRAWAAAEAGKRPPHPLHLDVDVTTACNFRCPICPAGASGHFFPGFQKGLFLERDLYRKALAEGASFALPSLRLGVTGEPLLIPDIDEWVAEAKEYGLLDISLITNGRLLTPELSARLIGAGLTRLMISVDAGGPETYSRVRPGGDWDLLLHNMQEFLRTRREMGSLTPLLRTSFVEMATNISDREKFIETFEPLADYLSFQRYLNIFPALEGKAAAAPACAKSYCAEPFTRMAIFADGSLFPCCADFGRIKPLGNLKYGSLLAIWQSDEALTLAREDAGAYAPCRECRAAGG